MIKERLKEMELKITDLSEFLKVSRPTMYKFIEAYDKGDFTIIQKPIFDLFQYIESDPLMGKRAAIAFIISNQTKELEVKNVAEECIDQEIQILLKQQPDSDKNLFIKLLLQKSDFDDVIQYLLKITPILRKQRLSESEIQLLKPYNDIQTLIKNS